MVLNLKKLALFAAIGMAFGCTNEEQTISNGVESPNLIAEVELMEEENATRVSVDPTTLNTTSSPSYYWNYGDEIGVWTSRSQKNLRYINQNVEDTKSVTFTPAQGVTVNGTPNYAYFPYSAEAGTTVTSLNGSIPTMQVIEEDLCNVPGKYLYGYHSSTSKGVSKFSFKHLFATIRFRLNADDTELAGDELQGVDITIARKGAAVKFCGDFKFNARYGTYTQGSNASNQVSIEFAGKPALDGNVAFLTTAFPTIKKGDVMTFVVRTKGYTATFTETVTTTMQKNYTYTYTLPIADYDAEIVANEVEEPEQPVDPDPETPVDPEDPTDPTDPENPEGGDNGDDNGDNNEGGNTGDNNEGGNTGDNTDPETPVEPEVPVVPTPEVVTGTFKCATYNVDGLPNILGINSDGPGSSGTNHISSKIAAGSWDFVGFSEDFDNHDELMSNMSGFAFGKHRGSVGTSQLFKTADTDGLGFATRNATCSFSNESWTQFTNSSGGLTSGANTCIKKGIRHYVVTMADGVEIDVIITHMNTYSSSGNGHINAQHAQLTQIAQYINDLMAKNERPVVFMGDTNCRYTRHDFQTYFWSKLNSDITYADPWVEIQWNGTYPTYPSKSLMVSDATGTDSSTDIICEDTQKGEVVDKVIYFNKPTNKVQIKANSYLRDYDGYKGLADHMPIVVDFTYSYTK